MTVAESIETRRELPKGWRWARLGELGEYINGMAFKPEDWRTTGLPIIRIQNLNDPSASFNCYDGDVPERYKVNDGDLLISWSASLDAYIWRRGKAILNQHIFRVEENTSVVTREYLYFAVREAMDEIRSQVHGATMRHITKPGFEAILIPLPPLPEQRRIAALLSEQMAAVERARAAAEARLEAARALPAAYLREVFESEEARGWPKRKLGAISTLLPAHSIATQGDATVQAITTACLTEAGFDPAGIKIGRMRSEDAQEALVRPGEVLIARSNTPQLVGRVARYTGTPPGVVASDLTIRIWPSSDIDGRFLTFYLSSLFLSGYWQEHAGGASGSMKKITRSQLIEIAIPCPDLPQQQEVAALLEERLTEARRSTEILRSQLSTVEALPAALLRQAFNGEL